MLLKNYIVISFSSPLPHLTPPSSLLHEYEDSSQLPSGEIQNLYMMMVISPFRAPAVVFESTNFRRRSSVVPAISNLDGQFRIARAKNVTIVVVSHDSLKTQCQIV